MKILRWMLVLICLTALPAFGQKAKVHDYATRLAALLEDTQGKANIGAASWKAIANEATSLANKLVAFAAVNGKSRGLALDARKHVREMAKAAGNGDADGARSHAALALPFVVQLIDWSAPK